MSAYSRSAAIRSGVRLVVTILQPRAALDHARHVRSRRHDLLEVVQEQKCLLVTDQYGDALPECPFFGFLHVQRIRESGDELRRIRHVGQRDERDTVQELGREQPAQLDDDARLSNTAGARDRNDPMFVRQLDERRQISGSADEWRGRLRQVARQTGEALALAFERLRSRHHDALGRDCVELERAPDVLEPEPSQADDADVAPVLDLLVRGVGQHHPARYGEGLDPSRDVHSVTGEPLGIDDHLAHMDSDADRNVFRREFPLDLDCGEHRGKRAGEHAHAAVAEPLDDRPTEGVVVALERTHVPVAFVECHTLVRLDERRVSDHVGEHHRDEPTI